LDKGENTHTAALLEKEREKRLREWRTERWMEREKKQTILSCTPALLIVHTQEELTKFGYRSERKVETAHKERESKIAERRQLKRETHTILSFSTSTHYYRLYLHKWTYPNLGIVQRGK
jgi:hypothetical protein